jgi:antitoxin HicB
MRYPVTITPDDGQFIVTFPDVPEAVTFGETWDEALQRAPDALLTIFDAFMKDRRDIPAPSQTAGDAIELPALESAKIELYRTMRAGSVGKAELARRLHWHLPQVDRVLRMKHGSQLDQMEAAFAALGKKLVLTVADKYEMDAVPRRAKDRFRPASEMVAKRRYKRGDPPGVHPGVLMRRARSVRTHAASRVTAGRRGTARKAAKKR